MLLTMPRALGCALILTTVQVAQESRPAPALKGFDPVELCAGREVPGRESWTVARGRHAYVFASERNKTAFEQAPERFEIQMGGACARMGPRSGRGSPDRFAVHDGRIYVFASDQCRAGFLKAPEKFLDPDDPPPEGDEGARRQGAALIEKAVAALGGAARLDAVKSCDAIRSRTEATPEGERHDRVRLRILGSKHRLDESYGNWSFTTVVAGESGFTIGNDEKVEVLDPSGVRDFNREMMRNPIAPLRARKTRGFVAVTRPPPTGSTLAWVSVGIGGTTTAIGLDPGSGEIRETLHRGRGPTLWFGQILRRYSDYRETGGLRVPHRVELVFDGKPRPDETRLFESITFDAPIPDAEFERPKR